MFGYSNINISLSGNPLIFILLVLIWIGLTVFIYRTTNPPVSKRWRYALIILRILSLTIVMLILFQPLLSLTIRRQEKPVIGVLIDNSASMGLVDEDLQRDAVVRELLRSSTFADLAKKYSVKMFAFSEDISNIDFEQLDSLNFNDEGTNLAKVVEELKEQMTEEYFAAVLLISDGVYNLGENPLRSAQRYGVPIYTLGIGSPHEQKDILIANIATNEITYSQNKVPVDVTVRSSGFQGQKVVVALKHKGQVLDSKILQLTEGSFESSVRLHYLAAEEGLQKYEIEVPALKGELTVENNRRFFYVKILKSKMKVLLIAGSPSPDYSFVKRILERDKNIELYTLVQRKGGSFYQNQWPSVKTKIHQYDCLFLIGFPQRDSNLQVIGDIVELVVTKNEAICYLMGKGVDPQKLKELEEVLPFKIQGRMGKENLTYSQLSAEGQRHPVMRLLDDETKNLEEWGKLPPIFSPAKRFFGIKEGSTVLGWGKLERSNFAAAEKMIGPLIVARQVGGRKSLAILASGLWRWDLMMWGAGKTNDAFVKFLGNVVRWLVTKEDSKLVRIQPGKPIYRSGEKVEFNAQVYYEDYRPLDGAEVTVGVYRDGEKYTLRLRGIGNGKYAGELKVLAGGDYRSQGEATYKGKKWGTDEGKFSIGDFSIEFLNTRMDEDLLRKISQVSGGKFYQPKNFKDLSKDLLFPNRELIQQKELNLWDNLWLLAALLILLSTEWTIRRRKGMV